jgi:hypothetical protein
VIVMASSDALVEQWLAQTIESYPHLTAGFLASERDPFRNPAGHALRSSMSALVEELLGNWEAERIAPALDAIVRLRVVQDFTPSQAVGFVFLLRPILLATNPARPATIEARIDQLALMAFDQYVKCREQIEEVRANEVRRRIRLRPVLRRQ